MNPMNIRWQWVSFNELTTTELYALLQLRQEVFAVEQNCVYQDLDGRDQQSLHLLGWMTTEEAEQLVAYVRVLPPGVAYNECSIGRFVTALSVRGTGFGKALMNEALRNLYREYPNQAVRISAQHHLEGVYAKYGFKAASEPYMEDGIPHIAMVLEVADAPVASEQ